MSFIGFSVAHHVPCVIFVYWRINVILISYIVLAVIKFSQNGLGRRPATYLAFHHLQLSLHHLVMPFGQLIFWKIIKIFATRGQVLSLKRNKFYFGWASVPEPAGEGRKKEGRESKRKGMEDRMGGEGREMDRRKCRVPPPIQVPLSITE